MQNKRAYVILGAIIVLVAAAAFLAGRMLNGEVRNIAWGGPNGGRVSISLNDITPAPELPNRQADVTGGFVSRKDNTITVQAVSFGIGVGAISGDAPLDQNSGIEVEVVVTSETQIFKDVTEIPERVNGEIHNLQQAAAEGTLDDLNAQTFITVWGRRSGDRIVAEVLFYSDPRTIKKPGN